MIADLFRALEPIPAWVLDGWYANNSEKQAHAIACYRRPVCTEAERGAARAYAAEAKSETFGCAVCGQFAFDRPRVCFWCGR